MRRLAFRGLVCIAAGVGVVVAALGIGSASASEAQRPACAGRGDVSFRATDGTRLVGHRFGKGQQAVVLAHEVREDLCQWVPYARRLAGRGYVAFAFDFRNHGRSQWVGAARGARLAGDVAAAVRYVRKQGARKVFVVGASMGGSAVLVAAANLRPPVAGVVSLSGPKSFPGAEAGIAVPRLTAPVLFLAAEDDAAGAFAADAHELYHRASSADKAIEVVEGSAHGVVLVSGPGRSRDLVETFLRSH